jgi:hypothetical protein
MTSLCCCQGLLPCLIAGGVLGSDTEQLLSGVPDNVIRCPEGRRLVRVMYAAPSHLCPGPLEPQQCPFWPLCLPWQGFHAWHLGCTPMFP